MQALPKNIFVTGIDTNVGKTVVCAGLVQALGADYWKPVQSGTIEGTDSANIKNLISETGVVFHKETYSLQAPAVPAFAAGEEGVAIDPAAFYVPLTNNRLIVEGAGGLMVHLNEEFMIIDLIRQIELPVILVSKNYLGSINHTLLSIEALKSRDIPILGIIYNGDAVEYSRQLIFASSGVPQIGSIAQAEVLTKEFIRQQAMILRHSLAEHFSL